MRFKLKIFFFLCFLVCKNSFSQQKEIDSLKNLLSIQSTDTAQINTKLKIARKYLIFNRDSYAFYARSALKQSQKSMTKYRIADCLVAVGLSKHHQSQVDSSRYYYDKALTVLKAKPDSAILYRIYNNYALTYEGSNNFEQRIAYNLKALALVENKPEEACLTYYNIATVYGNARLDSLSLKFLKKAYKASKEVKNNRVLGATIYGLGIIYRNLNQLDSAKTYLKEGTTICLKTSSPELCYLFHNQLGLIYNDEGKYDEAFENLIIGKKYAKELNDPFNVMVSNVSLGTVEYERKEYLNSKKYFEEFWETYSKGNYPSLGISSIKDWARTEFKLKNYKKSSELLLNYANLNDSVLSKEKRTIITEAEKKYETEKKEREIAEQQVTIAKQEVSLAKKQQQLAIWGSLGGVLALLLAASFWLGKERQKRKEQEITALKNKQEIIRLESLVSGEEKERVRLAQDLHDGINGDLSVIKFKVDSINRKKLSKGEKAAVDNTLGMLDSTIDQVRRISHNLVPPSLQNFNLEEAIKQHLGKIQIAHKIHVDFQSFGKPPQFSVEQETALYRIVQELVNNIVKHAEATETLVQLNHTNEFTELVIEDNGKGFDTKISKNGIGLQNIASRAAFLKGDLNIESSKEGSTFTVTIPKSNIL